MEAPPPCSPAREGQAVPPPEVVDVEVSVAGPDGTQELALLGENEPIEGKTMPDMATI